MWESVSGKTVYQAFVVRQNPRPNRRPWLEFLNPFSPNDFDQRSGLFEEAPQSLFFGNLRNGIASNATEKIE